MKARSVKLDANMFPSLHDIEIMNMLDREAKKLSFCFEIDGNKTFHVFIDLDNESIHVRHIGGAFAWEWESVLTLCKAISETSGHKKVTVIADKSFMVFAVKRLGFELTKENDLYEKVL